MVNPHGLVLQSAKLTVVNVQRMAVLAVLFCLALVVLAVPEGHQRVGILTRKQPYMVVVVVVALEDIAVPEAMVAQTTALAQQRLVQVEQTAPVAAVAAAVVVLAGLLLPR